MNRRLLLIGGGFVALFGAIGLRLVDLGLDGLDRAVAAPAATRSATSPVRADLLDRAGRVLATTVPAPRIVADPRRVRDPEREAALLATTLDGLAVDDLARRLASDRHWIVVRREASLAEVEAVRRLGLPAVDVEYRQARVYPNGRLGAHVVGYVDVDNNGLSGAELAFDTALRGAAPRPVRLALDLAVQAAVTEELERALELYRAKAGSALVVAVGTGEIIAAASLPDFDPHHPADADEDARKDRNTTQTFELGSVFKLVNVAMGLAAGTVRVDDRIDISTTLRVNGLPINDFRPKKPVVTVAEALMHSSNIANAKIALRTGAAKQRAFLAGLGLDRALPLETGAVAAPQLPRRWRESTTATVAFGHGIAVTPLHLVSAVAALLGPGHLTEPTLRRRDAPVAGTPVIDAEVVRTMRGLAYRVAVEGSGQQALVDGYLIGGKTGTAEKIGPDGRYMDGRVRSSFVAAVPIHEPAYVVYVVLDEPQGPPEHRDLYFGSWTAAPTVGRIIARMGPILRLKPSPPGAVDDLRRWGGLAPTTAAERHTGESDAARRSRG